MDLSIRTEFADHHDAKFTDFGNYGHGFGNLCISVDDLERRLYSEYVSGDDHGSTDPDDLERRSQSKLM